MLPARMSFAGGLVRFMFVRSGDKCQAWALKSAVACSAPCFSNTICSQYVQGFLSNTFEIMNHGYRLDCVGNVKSVLKSKALKSDET